MQLMSGTLNAVNDNKPGHTVLPRKNLMLDRQTIESAASSGIFQRTKISAGDSIPTFADKKLSSLRKTIISLH